MYTLITLKSPILLPCGPAQPAVSAAVLIMVGTQLRGDDATVQVTVQGFYHAASEGLFDRPVALSRPFPACVANDNVAGFCVCDEVPGLPPPG